MNVKFNELFILISISFGAAYVLADAPTLEIAEKSESQTLPPNISPVLNLSNENEKSAAGISVSPKMPTEVVVKSLPEIAPENAGSSISAAVPAIDSSAGASSQSSSNAAAAEAAAAAVTKFSSVETTATITHKPTTTTPKPTTTTPKPTTTTTTTTSTTTTTTTTTTTEMPTTTEPVPVPNPLERGKWILKDEKTNMTCIIAQMVMQLNITYPVNNKVMQNTTINVPAKNSTVSGSCHNSTMVISWGPGHSLQINFGKNESAKDFYVSGLSLNVMAKVLKNYSGNATSIKSMSQTQEFATPLDMSYKCDKSQVLNLTSLEPKTTTVLTLRDTQLEAFMNKTNPEFGAAQDCDVFDTPDIVPIAVGCALAILVLVVLVAYLIGRKRSQNRGYLSM